MSRTAVARRAAGLVAGLLVAHLLNPAPARAVDPLAQSGPPLAAPGAEATAADPVAETTVTATAAAAELVPPPPGADRVAVPVIRGEGLYLYVVRLAAFGLTAADLTAAGLPVVAAPSATSGPVSATAPVAVPIQTAVDTVGRLSGARAAAASGEPETTATAAATAQARNIAITVYSDQSNWAYGDSVARSAWNDTVAVLSEQAGVTFDVVLYQEDAAAFPNDPALLVTAVNDMCGLQRFARWEEIQPRVTGQLVLVFSDGTATYDGKEFYGAAIDHTLTHRYSRGQSRDYCTAGATRSPAYIPSAVTSTDLSAVPSWWSEKPAPTHWAAHEVAHMLGMRHGDMKCWSDIFYPFQQRQTLEAATGNFEDWGAGCEKDVGNRHNEFEFNTPTQQRMRDQHQRYDTCHVPGTKDWCTDADATPSAPRNLVATPQNGQVSLTWDEPLYNKERVSGYCVYRGRQPDFLERDVEGPEFQQVCLGNQRHYTWSGLTNGETYYFYVRAWRSEGATRAERDGPRSDDVPAKPGAAPSSPTLNAPVPGDRQVSLSWNVPAGNGYPVTSYKVFRGTCSLCQTYLGTATTNSYVDRDPTLVNGQRYYYQVSAVNDRGEGARSNEQSTYPRTTPGAPSLIGASPANRQVTLTWNAPASDGGDPVSGYRVYRGTVQNGGKTLVEAGGCKNDVVGWTSCTDTDPALVNGVRYYYAVKAVNSAGDGASSNELAAMPANAAEEEWEIGLHGWTVTGAAVSGDCAVGYSGCSLALAPTGSGGASAKRSMPVTLDTPTAVSFWFRGQWTQGDTDMSVGIGLDSGNEVRLALTNPAAYDSSMNNGVSLSSPGGSTGTFYHWPYYQEWYQAVVLLNPATDQASVRVKTASGSVVGTSGTIPLPAAATAVTQVSFDGVFWGGTSVEFHFDRLKVNDPAAIAAFAETWDNGLGGWTVTGSGASGDCAVAFAGCSLKVESLDSAGVTVAKPIWVALNQPTTVSFWLRGDRTWGDTDASVGIGLNTQNEVRLAITEPDNNNGMNLYTPNGSSGVFYNWPNANTWYQVAVTVDPVADVARVQVKDASGTVLRTSSNVAIPANASALNRLSFDAVHWGGSAVTFHVDTLTVL